MYSVNLAKEIDLDQIEKLNNFKKSDKRTYLAAIFQMPSRNHTYHHPEDAG